MTFIERIKQLRESLQIPQRKMAAALDIDTATYCKFEKGERKVRREHLPIIAHFLRADEKELLKFWLADQVTKIVAEEKEISNDILKIVKDNIK
jgi:transcriptional regulator with XRE-family HTH domain